MGDHGTSDAVVQDLFPTTVDRANVCSTPPLRPWNCSPYETGDLWLFKAARAFRKASYTEKLTRCSTATCFEHVNATPAPHNSQIPRSPDSILTRCDPLIPSLPPVKCTFCKHCRESGSSSSHLKCHYDKAHHPTKQVAEVSFSATFSQS